MNFAGSRKTSPARESPRASPVPGAARPLSPRSEGGAFPCACGGGCPRCATPGRPLPAAQRAHPESALRADFSGVRVHRDASGITAPLRARAVTLGQDIYFHPGEFQPDTSKGKSLLAHELAHTLQTRGSEAADSASASVSRPGDALERNADALTRGETRRALAAPAGAVLRSPFDSESADERTRREALLQSINNAIDRLVRMLQSGGLIETTEVPVVRKGTRGIIYGAHTAGTPDEQFTSYADRDVRIRRIIGFLMAMGMRYRRYPIPPEFTAPVRTESGDYDSAVITYPAGGSKTGSVGYSGSTPEWADLQAAYERYLISQGHSGATYDSDWYYLDPSYQIVPGAARGAPRIGGGIQTGAYMIVPDIDREPLRYWPLTGSSPRPSGSTIVEFWHDDLGYYYMHAGQRIDVPSPWSSESK